MPNVLYDKPSHFKVGSVPLPISQTQHDTCPNGEVEYYDKALLDYDNKHLLDAITALEKVVNINQFYKDASERLGYYRQELDGIKLNEVILRDQLRENPTDAECRYDLADTLNVLGKTEDAIITLRELAMQDTGYWGKRARKMLEQVESTFATP